MEVMTQHLHHVLLVRKETSPTFAHRQGCGQIYMKVWTSFMHTKL